MGIKGIITLFALGGLAAGAYYYRDGIKEAYADGKQKAIDVKDKLQDGSGGSNDSSDNSNYHSATPPQLPLSPPAQENSKPQSKTEYVYVLIQNNGQSSLGKDTPQSEVIQAKTQPEIEQAIQRDRKKTESTINKHSSPYARKNTDAYAKQKYGIDYDKLKSAKGKTPSKRTIDEKKQIEAEKARAIFDSRRISNW